MYNMLTASCIIFLYLVEWNSWFIRKSIGLPQSQGLPW